MARSIKVFEVLADTDGEGPTGDGTVVFRFRRKREADAFAARNTCWGHPASVSEHEAPLRLAQRWGLA